MSDKIRDAERRQIRDALEAANKGDWSKIASEIDYGRNQIYFWFLVRDRAGLQRAVDKAMRVLQPFALERPRAEFNAGFIELTETQKIDWETIDDDEIRRGRLDRPAGSAQTAKARRDTSVFDRPDYSIPPSEEPI